jgi:hypothetical protein
LTSGLRDTEAVRTDPTIANGTPAGPPGAAAVTAVVLATAPSTGGGPAALLSLGDETILGRLTRQIAGLGVLKTIVLTRPAWEAEVRARVGSAAEVRASASTAEDLRAIAALAAADGPLVVMYGDIVAHAEALRGLIADPRASTTILAGGKRRRMTFRVQARRGRMVSAGSPYHAVGRSNGSFLGVLRAAPADLPALAAAAERLAPLVTAPPQSWLEELDRKTGVWRLAATRAAGHDEDVGEDDHTGEHDDVDEPVDAAEPVGVEIVLSDENEAWVRNRIAAAREDAVALLLLGLVRSAAQVSGVNLRRLFWTRPLSPEAATAAAERLAALDEDRLLLDSAVKSMDGFFTTHFVSPYSKYIARWAARRGFTPNQVTTASMLIGILAAAGFATGERWGLVAGAVLLQIAFTTDCIDGQLARYTRQFSSFGAWLDSVFDRTKEYLVFAGLAIGASRAGDPVWLLACCALALQTFRHMADFSYGGTQQRSFTAAPQPPLEQARDIASAAAARRATEGAAQMPARRPLAARVLGTWRMLDRVSPIRWAKRMITFPIGERFAVISVTAALFTPRVTFIALLAWTGVGIAYAQTGRVLRALR